ncbi:unnamed protein product [Ilex paraguariensis]|uniref:Aspartate kinase n=1 Tax=Ilex paraguariensis TaxID=185542 RepID=A0ABC8UPK2_9AQUA
MEDEVDAGVEMFGTSQALGAAAVQALGAFTDRAGKCAAHVVSEQERVLGAHMGEHGELGVEGTDLGELPGRADNLGVLLGCVDSLGLELLLLSMKGIDRVIIESDLEEACRLLLNQGYDNPA